MDKIEVVQLDIEQVIKDKAPKLGKKLPRFLYRFLAKTICQERMNYLLRTYADCVGVDFAKAVLKDLNVTIEVKGLENIPTDKRFVFASNHPLGGLDGIGLVAILGDKYQSKIKYLVNDVLMNIKPLAPVFVPINKYGAQGKGAAGSVSEAYASEEDQVIVFPAGICSRRQKGGIKDYEWKKSFVAKAVQTKRDIVPIYFDGYNSTFFYNFAYWRKKLGIKANLELFFLPSEIFKNENKTFTVYVGEPMPWQKFDKSKSHVQWAEEIKQHVYQLKVSV